MNHSFYYGKAGRGRVPLLAEHFLGNEFPNPPDGGAHRSVRIRFYFPIAVVAVGGDFHHFAARSGDFNGQAVAYGALAPLAGVTLRGEPVQTGERIQRSH